MYIKSFPSIEMCTFFLKVKLLHDILHKPKRMDYGNNLK